MKTKRKWGFTVLIAAFVLFSLLSLFLGVTKSKPQFAFMKGAVQDGFWAPIIDGSASVNRFYQIYEPFEDVLAKAESELTSKGWKQVNIVTSDDTVIFSLLQDSVLVSRIDEGTTSIVVSGHANKAEELIGATYESIPHRFESWR